MKFISTRGNKEIKNFKQVTLRGLATDGGLYVPKDWKIEKKNILKKSLSFENIAFEVIKCFTGNSLKKKKLKEIISKSYEPFRHNEITPLKHLDKNNFLLELYHGPTLAFKDIALQFLGNTFDEFLEKKEKKLCIIGATSGDTGSAAIDAVKRNKFSSIFILHPYRRVSDFQRRQMTTVKSKNVFNIAVKGTFDDCQNIVKKLFIDENLNSQLRLGSINSINWTRIMAQISYYIFSYNKVKEEYKNKKVSFCVPTGNFGDAFAGYIAKEKFNVPINKIIIATNKNNILDRFFKTGIYKKEKVYQTMSPSMDIQIASNFERLLYDLYNQDGNIINDLMNDFSKNGIIKVNNKSFKKTKKIFLSFSINEKETMNSILHAYKKNQIIVDPHTAVGLEASRKFIKKK